MELEKVALISDAIAKRRASAQELQSAEQARGYIPEFQKRLSKLIVANVVREIKKEDTFDTRLDCGIIIPDDPERIKVVILSSCYPKAGETPNFEISVEENDSRLTINHGGIRVVSKADSDVPKDSGHIVMGGKYNFWPKWERDATMEDAQKPTLTFWRL